MSMDGKRFGAGLAAGILFAAVIVAAVGAIGASAPQVEFGNVGSGSAAETTTSTSTASTLSTTSFTSATAPASNNSTKSASNLTASTSGTSTSSENRPSFGGGANSGTPVPSANFAAISLQGPGSNAFLVIPVVVALLLGAAIYRASSRGRDEVKSEKAPEG